jgi:hypothetical protein
MRMINMDTNSAHIKTVESLITFVHEKEPEIANIFFRFLKIVEVQNKKIGELENEIEDLKTKKLNNPNYDNDY